LLGVTGLLAAIVGGDALKGEVSPLVLAMAVLGAPLGWVLIGVAAQLWTRDIASIMRKRNHAPILYLRSFRADARWLERPIDLLWMFLLPGRFETLEHSLTKSLTQVGPLIAIGQPGEMLRPMGAARLYVKHDKRQEVVAHLSRISGLILLRVGSTESFWWEVEHVVESCPPEKILFLLPPHKPLHAYNALARQLAPRLQQNFPQPSRDMRFVGFRSDWSPVLLGKEQISLMSRFRTLLIGSAAPVLRDELLPALRHAGYWVGRLPLQFREWVLLMLVVGVPAALGLVYLMLLS
jgi:hypothetical protein